MFLLQFDCCSCLCFGGRGSVSPFTVILALYVFILLIIKHGAYCLENKLCLYVMLLKCLQLRQKILIILVSYFLSQFFDCRNHIRVIQPMADGGRLYVCGTNAHNPKDWVIYVSITGYFSHQMYSVNSEIRCYSHKVANKASPGRGCGGSCKEMHLSMHLRVSSIFAV